MHRHAARRLSPIAIAGLCLSLASGCGGSSPTAPTPVQVMETFNGTLQPLGVDFKTFVVNYNQGTSDLSVTINRLATVLDSTPITGITLGVGFGAVAGTTCSMQVQTPVATLGQELFAPNGASAGAYCVQVFDCPTGATGCTSNLTEATAYTITVKHY